MKTSQPNGSPELDQTASSAPDLQANAVKAALAGFFAMALAMGIARFFYTPVLPPMIEAGRLTPAEGGFAAGANFLGYLIGALFASSSFFDRHRQRWLFAALAACTATTALSGWWLGIYGFSAIRFLAGIASAFSMVFVSAIVLKAFQDAGRPGLIALHFAGVGFGIAVAALLVPIVANLQLNWATMWVSAGLAGFAMWLAAFWLLPSQSGSAPHATSAIQSTGVIQSTGKKQAGGERPERLPSAFWLLLAGYGFFGFGYSVSGTFIKTIANTSPMLAPAEPYVWLIVGLSGIPSIWLWNRLAETYGLARIYAVACAVEAVGILLLLLVPTPTTLLVSGITLGGTFMAVTALGLAKGRSLATQDAARALAFMTAAFGLGQMTGPVLAGFLFDLTGSFSAGLYAAVAALAMTVILTTLSIRRRA